MDTNIYIIEGVFEGTREQFDDTFMLIPTDEAMKETAKRFGEELRVMTEEEYKQYINETN